VKRLASLVLAACSAAPVIRPPAQTVIAPQAQSTLDAWAAAVGGRDRLAAQTAWHARGIIKKGGLTGHYEMWATARGEIRAVTDLGLIREVHVFDGTRGWLVDRNREVRDLDGVELDDALDEVFLETAAPLLPERRPGEITANADGTLTIVPRGSHRPMKMTFDSATHLPAGFSRRDAEKLRTTTWKDWRTVDGIKLAFTTHDDNGDPNDATTLELETVDRQAPPKDAFARPPDRESDAKLAKSPAEVPIETALDALVFVEVSVNGRPAMKFILDSGAESTVLNTSRLPKLGLTATGKFAAGAGGGDVELSYVSGVSFALPGVTIDKQIVAAIPLDQLEPMLGRPIDGILGYDFLSRFVVELEWKAKKMRLYDRETYRHTGAGEPVPFTLEGSTPQADAMITVPGREPLAGRFTIDTGCVCQVQLSSPFVDSNKLLDAVPDARETGFGAGAGGKTHEVSAKIPALTIGKLTIDHPRADFSRDKVGATADPELAGLIGSAVFREFRLVLDYRHKQLWLDPLPK
jgi:hypothetical protein